MKRNRVLRKHVMEHLTREILPDEVALPWIPMGWAGISQLKVEEKYRTPRPEQSLWMR